MKEIKENVIEVSETDSQSKFKDDSDDEEDLGRTEERIDLKDVDVTSKASPTKKGKPLVSAEEVKEIRKS